MNRKNSVQFQSDDGQLMTKIIKKRVVIAK